MIRSKFALNRRTFLRGMVGGVAVSMALPPLEAMFNANGTAYAGGGAIPKRMGVWFWGNGMRPERWTPSGTGASWTANAEMQPLTSIAGLQQYISPVTGCELKTRFHPHHGGMCCIMTGMPLHQLGTTRDTIVSTFGGPSIDQVVARRWYDTMGMRTPIRTLEVGICRFHGTDEGTTFQHLSHNGPSMPNPSEYNPRTLFNRLFGMRTSGQVAAARLSVLDAVRGDVTALRNQVSATDRVRLDAHMESIRTIENRLGAVAGTCTTPAMPGDYPDVGGREQIAEKNQVMSDLIATALACDLTRVFSVLFSTCGAGTVFWQAGATNGQHQLNHDEGAPYTTTHNTVVFTMQQLAYFLNKLRTTMEGAGNLLDSCVILCTSEHARGHEHSRDEHPIIIAGKGGGTLRGGVHYRSSSNENITNALLTVLRATGDTRPSFGTAEGTTSTALGPLLT